MKEVADEVLEALLQIPLILSGAQRVMLLYKDSKKLEACSSALYSSVLEALGHVLSYLHKKSISRSLKLAVRALVQQSDFATDIGEKIKAMRKSRDNFNAEADVCQKEMVKDMHAMTETGRNAAKDVQTKMNAMSKALEEANLEKKRSADEISQGLKSIEETISNLRNDVAVIQKFNVAIESLLRASPVALEEAIANRTRFNKQP